MKAFPRCRVSPFFQIKQSLALMIPNAACNRFEVCVAVNLCPPAVYSRFDGDTGSSKNTGSYVVHLPTASNSWRTAWYIDVEDGFLIAKRNILQTSRWSASAPYQLSKQCQASQHSGTWKM